jgi:hypothetical protein
MPRLGIGRVWHRCVHGPLTMRISSIPSASSASHAQAPHISAAGG